MNMRLGSTAATLPSSACAMLAATLLCSAALHAQSAADHVVLGDRARATMDASGALRHYEAAVQADSTDAEALWRASNEAVDLGEFDPATRDSLYRLGEQYARRAVQANGKSPMARFALAKALGRRAQSLGPLDRVRYAAAVRGEAREALSLDSLNAGALHVMGMWHAEIMRLSGLSRFVAKTLLGGRIFGEANWNDATEHLERAAALEPERIVHRLELASIYAETGDKAKAREQYQVAGRLKPLEYNDKRYQDRARRSLKELR